ncbi:hypothetical protein [Curtobacterium sp. Leaf261]|uniref:hypothetical protein n=1 Tax=Curtobacterium sp. Leaf261 TaxID=1736311 RepID=UPI000701456D|nr:hypothetical protein [Curtobacterium sp. Leaf261]KQO61183.1 hypothetical protein ASF23_11815 [Curtobacterium sp. Leaf261]
MTRRGVALTVVGGLGAVVVAWVTMGMTVAGMILLATLVFAASARPVVGNTPISAGTTIDPRAVRRYREQHPGATITDAIAALQR